VATTFANPSAAGAFLFLEGELLTGTSARTTLIVNAYLTIVGISGLVGMKEILSPNVERLLNIAGIMRHKMAATAW
jgi:hypothetical protein